MILPKQDPQSEPDEFARQGAMRPSSMLGEYWYFLKSTRKWWLLPILTVLIVLGALVVLSGSPAAPFIYALF